MLWLVVFELIVMLRCYQVCTAYKQCHKLKPQIKKVIKLPGRNTTKTQDLEVNDPNLLLRQVSELLLKTTWHPGTIEPG